MQKKKRSSIRPVLSVKSFSLFLQRVSSPNSNCIRADPVFLTVNPVSHIIHTHGPAVFNNRHQLPDCRAVRMHTRADLYVIENNNNKKKEGREI